MNQVEKVMAAIETAEQPEKPEMMTEEHLEFLDELRESGETNMFGATPYLTDDFPELSKWDARAILSYWMRTFSDRHA